jgi:activating signal cointegrator complex subunit 3
MLVDMLDLCSPSYRSEMQRLVGYRISDASIQKVASSAYKLYTLQHMENQAQATPIDTGRSKDSSFEFGSDLTFNTPSRFLVDIPVEEDDDTFQTGLYDDRPMLQNYCSTDRRGSLSLRLLKEACDRIAGSSGSQLSGDDLAMALSRVLILNKQGDEVNP